MDFSDALKLLKVGYRLKREGWNAPNQYIYLIADNRSWPNHLPYLAIKTVQNKWVPWLASQTDMLAEDWSQLKPEDYVNYD